MLSYEDFKSIRKYEIRKNIKKSYLFEASNSSLYTEFCFLNFLVLWSLLAEEYYIIEHIDKNEN